MTVTSSNQDEENQANAQDRPQSRADRMKWMNNPDTVHSMADVDEEGKAERAQDGSSFCLTEGESVIASKVTARAEAEAKGTAWEEAIVNVHKIPAAAAGEPNMDALLAQWSGQKQARKAPAPDLQEDILKRIRSEIDLELDQIRQARCPISSTLILMARAFGKDPNQWLPAEKVSNLLIEAVLYSAGLDLPWGFDSLPDYAELKYILSQDKRFTRVFRYDKYQPNKSAQDFANYPAEDGDIAIWINPDSKLSGFIEKAEEGRHNILSAGCPDTPTGFIYTTMEFYAQTYAPGGTVPDVVYRLIRLGRS